MATIRADMIQVHPFRISGRRIEYLLLRRAADRHYGPLVWQVVTGTVKHGESSLEAARREVLEETSCHCNEWIVHPEVVSFYFEPTDSIVLSPLIACRLDDEPVLSEEHCEYEWLEVDAADARLPFPSFRRGLELFDRLLRERLATIGVLLLFFVGLQACSVPRIPIAQSFSRVGGYDTAGYRVVELRAEDPGSVSTSDPLLRQEYFPVYVNVVLDPRDSVQLVAVAGWQEYRWRYSERLQPVDKQYFLPVPSKFNWTGERVEIIWGYPEVEGRDRDLKYAEIRRNSYWSVDVFRSDGATGVEHSSGAIQSVPLYGHYSLRERFLPDGAFYQMVTDSVAAAREVRRLVLESAPIGTRNAGN